jgi:hypothetical protein
MSHIVRAETNRKRELALEWSHLEFLAARFVFAAEPG